MAYQLGSLLGGTLLAFAVMSLVRWIMSRSGSWPDAARIAIPAAVFLVAATILGGYGFARGDEGPQFLRALERYAPPAVLVTLIFAYLDYRARQRGGGTGPGGTA